MGNFVRGLVVLAMATAAGCATGVERDDIAMPLDDGWKVGHEQLVPEEYSIIEFVRKADDIGNWRELVTLQNFGGAPSGTPEDGMALLKAQMQRDCAGALVEWNVIERDDSSILFEWLAAPCSGFPAQHEIARIIHGRHNVFVVAYTAKTAALSQESRAEWITWAGDVHVVTNVR